MNSFGAGLLCELYIFLSAIASGLVRVRLYTWCN